MGIGVRSADGDLYVSDSRDVKTVVTAVPEIARRFLGGAWRTVEGDAGSGSGGSQPGALVCAGIVEFTETAGAGVYTGTVDIPANARLNRLDWQTPVTWDAFTATLEISDESGLLFTDSVESSPDQLAIAYDASTGTWDADAGLIKLFEGKPYPSGQTITVTITTADASGPNGRGLFGAYYLADPDTAAAVKS